jgi:DNA-binding winged helix-turn-helix (wHTH) protein
MREKPDFYDFEGIRLFLTETHIEVIATGKHFTPSKNHRGFLLALLRNAPNVVTYRKLWKEVWHLDEMSDTDLRNIHTTKGNLVIWLKGIGLKNPPIEPESGKGYRLNCKVIQGWFEDAQQSNLFEEGTDKESGKDTGFSEERQIENWREILKSYAGFIIPISVFYGVLFLITAILEVPYQFEKYGKAAVLGGLGLLALNGFAMMSAYVVIVYRLSRQKNAFLPAVGILLGAVFISIAVSALFLPLQPITEAVYQTQPAVIAFGKNMVVYFLPLGIIFLLLPFYIVTAGRLRQMRIIEKMPSDTIIIKPKWLLIICAGAIIYSLVSTNYMLDKLNAGSNYHALFVGMIMLRLIVCFGLALSSLAWYHTQVKRNLIV